MNFCQYWNVYTYTQLQYNHDLCVHSLRIPRAVLWAEISECNPNFISYDSTAKLAYLLHPTELIFIIAKGIHKLYMHRYTLLYHSHWYFLLSYIFSPFIFFVVAVVCPLSLLPSCICTCYAHTSLAHTYTVVTVHTHTQAGQFASHALHTVVPCTVTHYLLMHSPFVCSIHTMYAALIFCYIYTWGY